MRQLYALILYMLISMPAVHAQQCTDKGFRLVIVGTSTAAGWNGPSTIDSSFGRRLKVYLEAIHPDWHVYNIAVGGITSYSIQPSWYVPPVVAGNPRPNPDPTANITRAVNDFNPDAILMNIPSNDAAAGYTLDEQKANFNRIVAVADSLNIAIWVTTTQPRDQLWGAPRQPLMDMRDWITMRFGPKSIDFWTDFANPDGTINPTYAAGDGIHLNDFAHRVMFQRIVAKGIPDTLCKGPVRLSQLSVFAAPGSGAGIKWRTDAERYMGNYIIQRSRDSLNWDSTGVVTGNGSTIVVHNYTFTDNTPPGGNIFYRLMLRDTYNRVFYTAGVKYSSGTPPAAFVLNNFNGLADFDQRKLNWQTASENRAKWFRIERSTDSLNWNQLAIVNARGTSSVAQNYAYTDLQVPQQAFYYRLNMEDSTGSHTYSAAINIQPDPMYATPFILQSFSITRVNGNPYLQWSTAAEKNTRRFNIERSMDAVNWTAAGTVNAAGTSTSPLQYNFTDSGTYTQDVYFRLRMEDTSGRSFYSGNQKLSFTSTGFVTLTGFSGYADFSNNIISWQTASEVNMDKFVLQRSADSVGWDIIDFIPATGNSSTLQNYRYTVTMVPVYNFYYRLRMENVMGQGVYSNVITVIPDSMYIQPFRIKTFSGVKQPNSQLLQWTTSREKQTAKFMVQQSPNGWDWNTLTTIPAAGNSNTDISYSYTDNVNATQTVYYRLKMEDSLGRQFNSNTITFQPGSPLIAATAAGKANTVLIITAQASPNPFSNSFHVTGLTEGAHELEVFNASGTRVHRSQYYYAGTNVETSGWKSGVYFVVIDNGALKIKIVKQ